MRKILLILSVFIWQLSFSQPVLVTTIPEENYGYFSAFDDLYFFNEDTLWRSDGTAAGTGPLKYVAGEGSVGRETAYQTSTHFFFFVHSGGNYTMWRSDGTTAGTVAVDSYPWINTLDVLNNELIYGATKNGVTSLYRVGTGSPQLIAPVIPADAAKVNNIIMFEARIGADVELWRTDGTTAGTYQVRDFNGNETSGYFNVDGVLFFLNLSDSLGYQMWMSDGTPAGTTMVFPVQSIGEVYNVGSANGRVFFLTQFEDFKFLYAGNSAGSERVLSLVSTEVRSIGNVGNDLYLYDIIEGIHHQIWRLDGENLAEVVFESIVSEIAPAGSYLFLNSNGVWQTDRAPANTRSLAAIFPGLEINDISDLTAAGRVLYFVNPDGPGRLNLWRYDPLVPTIPQSYFTLVDANTDTDLSWIMDSTTIYHYQDEPFNIRYYPLRNPESVRFILNGSNYRTENVAPYALAGDNNGDYNIWSPPTGFYTLIAREYSGNNASGTLLHSDTIHFYIRYLDVPNQAPVVNAGPDRNIVLPTSSVTLSGTATDPDGTIEQVSWRFVSGPNVPVRINNSLSLTPTVTGLTAPGSYVFELTAVDHFGERASDQVTVMVTSPTPYVVASFSLINADTDRALFQLSSGDNLFLPGLPPNLNIRANTIPATVGSVRFQYDTGFNRVENQAPYSLFGDNNGDYNSGYISPGTHRLTATPYSGFNATGTAGPPLTITFTVVGPAKLSAVDEVRVISCYPNPSSDLVTVIVPVTEGENAIVEVFDHTGRLVEKLCEATMDTGSDISVQWDASEMTPGVYVIKVSIDDKIFTDRVVVK